jgi:hypothetical protein
MLKKELTNKQFCFWQEGKFVKVNSHPNGKESPQRAELIQVLTALLLQYRPYLQCIS